VTTDVQAALDTLRGSLVWMQGSLRPGVMKQSRDGLDALDVLARELERLRKGYFQPWEIEHLRTEVDRLLADRDAERVRADKFKAELARELERLERERAGGGDDYRLRMVSEARERMQAAEDRAEAAEADRDAERARANRLAAVIRAHWSPSQAERILAEHGSPEEARPNWGPEHPSYDEMGQ
jgi:hypothetical protein